MRKLLNAAGLPSKTPVQQIGQRWVMSLPPPPKYIYTKITTLEKGTLNGERCFLVFDELFRRFPFMPEPLKSLLPFRGRAHLSNQIVACA